MRPTVVLTVARDNGDVVRLASRRRYVEALERASAHVVTLGPGDALPERFDALCLSGGEDVEPWRYGAEPANVEVTDAERDELELAAAERALADDLPILGICLGFQVLNVAFGGGLVQHLEGHRPSATEVVTHVLRAEPGTLLAEQYGTVPFTVNSRHHQAVDDATLAPGLRATARQDEVIEAFESTQHRFVLGVQWHPERTADGLDHPERIFVSFVRAAAPPAPTT